MPNYWVWNNLNEEEKQIVKKNNLHDNKFREDYVDPTKYAGGNGENWDSDKDRLCSWRGIFLNNIFDKYKPKRILEIGPGPGFYTKLICKKETVEEYVSVDINNFFLEYLAPRLEILKNKKENFSFSLLCNEVEELNFNNYFDAIILLSTVHHIPDRFVFFDKLQSMLKDGGFIFCADPSHYLPRVCGLIKKFIFKGYLKKAFWKVKTNLGTHHFCTYLEYKKIAKKCNLKIIDERYIFHGGFVAKGHFIFRFLTREIGILFRK